MKKTGKTKRTKTRQMTKKSIKYIICSFFVIFTFFSIFNIATNTQAQTSTQTQNTKKSCTREGESIEHGKTTKDGTKKCNNGKLTCNGVKLNTNVPFIGNCIVIKKTEETRGGGDSNTTTVTQISAFPKLMGGLSKLMITLILSISFLLIIAAGVLMVVGGADSKRYKEGTDIIKKVVIALAVLGTSGLILRLINPNFFGG